jgi:hypothetical protein
MRRKSLTTRGYIKVRGTIDFSECNAEARERFLLPVTISYPASTAGLDVDVHLSREWCAIETWRYMLARRRRGQRGYPAPYYRALASIPPGLKLEDLPAGAVVTLAAEGGKKIEKKVDRFRERD